MIIRAERKGMSTVELFVGGRLDTAAAPQLERKIKQWGDDITELVIDFSQLTYISSMGLRVLLQTQKAMKAKDRKLIIQRLAEPVQEVFEMTGFINLLVQEERLVVIRKNEPRTVILSLLGQMDAGTVPLLEKELVQLKGDCQNLEEKTAVILDVEKLTALSTAGCRILKQCLADTSWEKRELTVRGASGPVLEAFQGEELQGLLEKQD